MYRQSLKPDEGMLFVFPHDEELAFYMKNTRVPLSIAFIKSDGVIANIAHMEPYSLETHRSRTRVPFRARNAVRLVCPERRRRGLEGGHSRPARGMNGPVFLWQEEVRDVAKKKTLVKRAHKKAARKARK